MNKRQRYCAIFVSLCLIAIRLAAQEWNGDWASSKMMSDGPPPVLAMTFTNLSGTMSTAGFALPGSFTSAAFTAPTNALVFAFVANAGTLSASITNIPTVSGAGLTWVLVDSTNTLNVAPNRVSVFRAMGNPTPGATASATWSGNGTITSQGIFIGGFRYAATNGANGAGAIVQSLMVTNTTQNPSITLTNIYANASNAVVGVFVKQTTTYAGTVDANWVEDYDAGVNNSPLGMYFSHRMATTQNVVSNSTGGTAAWAGIAIEVLQGDLTQ